ncbi:MAG: MepB family protein [Salibacteraceae bacterium]
MSDILQKIQERVFSQCGYQVSKLIKEPESADYEACRFQIDKKQVISRTAKLTPKKNGQFVTFWKRIRKGPIEPFHENDNFDFFVINIKLDNRLGQFVFPKKVLAEKGVISTNNKEGKRGFRVYPVWDNPNSGQAVKTQIWQLSYFFEMNNLLDLKKVKQLYT